MPPETMIPVSVSETSFSEPPVNMPNIPGSPATPSKPPKAATFADVAMRVAHDGPMYAVIALVGVLALKGQATSMEMVVTALGALLARSWPRAVQVPVVGAAIAFFLLSSLSACDPTFARPAAYGVELEECNRDAQTLQESIACENKVRERYNRPLRDAGARPAAWPRDAGEAGSP